jgi:hypothetical protein
MRMRPVICALLLLSLAAPALAQRERDPDPPWRAGALALVPQGYVAGEAYRREDSLGYLAVYPANANDPKTPLSVFPRREVLMVRLVDGKAVSALLQPRTDPTRGNRDTTQTDPDGTEQEHAASHEQLAAGRATLPAGTEPCDLRAWSADPDRNGLNVRAEPSAKARVLGKLPPPYRFKGGGSENTPPAGWLTEFRIIGYRDGWFLIEGAQPPGKRYEDAARYPRNAPKPYAGRGWVASSKVGATFANGGTRGGGLFQAPHADAHWMAAKNQHGAPLDGDFGPKRIFACSGLWALVESHDGVRGWWRALCASQVTNCS